MPNCTIFKQLNEITELRNLIKNLSSELANTITLEQKVIDLEQKLFPANESFSIPISDLAVVPLSLQSNTSTADDHISIIVSSYINEEKEKAKRRINLIHI